MDQIGLFEEFKMIVNRRALHLQCISTCLYIKNAAGIKTDVDE